MHQGSVRGWPKAEWPWPSWMATTLNLSRPDPCQIGVARRIVGGQQRPDLRRHAHGLVGFVNNMKRTDPRDNGVFPCGSDEDRLVVLDTGRGGGSHAVQAIAAADRVLGPPVPFLVVEQGMVQHDDASAALDKVAKVFLAGVVQIAREVVHDHDVEFVPQVLLEGGGAVSTGSHSRSL